jgi:hypothetical protein
MVGDTMTSVIYREVHTSVTESAANTYTETALALTSYFTAKELENGVIPVGGEIYIPLNDAASGANTRVKMEAHVAKKTKTAVGMFSDVDVLMHKALHGYAGASANLMHFMAPYEWPKRDDAEGKIFSALRAAKVDKDNPNTAVYCGCKSLNLAAVAAYTFKVKFAVIVP